MSERIRAMDGLASQLQEILLSHDSWVVLTGAGISADSGIPTYRDARGTWLSASPIQHQDFVTDPAARQRYWGRSMIGWPPVRDAQPNPNHTALVTFEQAGKTALLVTQNVDRLHQKAGSQRVVDLHGRLDRVICLDCSAGYTRDHVQAQLERLNPHHRGLAGGTRPDGDADLSPEQVQNIAILPCEACGGMLKPDVVFFGGSIPRERVSTCEDAITRADGLLVIGSSLQVYSGFRFCRQAHELGIPLVIVNEGLTRADELATLKISTQGLAVLREALGHWAPATGPIAGAQHG